MVAAPAGRLTSPGAGRPAHVPWRRTSGPRHTRTCGWQSTLPSREVDRVGPGQLHMSARHAEPLSTVQGSPSRHQCCLATTRSPAILPHEPKRRPKTAGQPGPPARAPGDRRAHRGTVARTGGPSSTARNVSLPGPVRASRSGRRSCCRTRSSCRRSCGPGCTRATRAGRTSYGWIAHRSGNRR